MHRESRALLDGHHRYELCRKHGIPFQVAEVSLPNRDAALDWIAVCQLGRRNISDYQRAMILAGLLARRKRKRGGSGSNQHVQKCHGDTSARDAAQEIADERGVSRRTIFRAAEFADAVEKVKAFDPEIWSKIVEGEAPLRKAVVTAAAILESHPSKAKDILDGRAKTPDVIREIRREEIIKRNAEVAERSVDAPTGTFDVVVCDPPWPMSRIDRDLYPMQTGLEYPTMTEEELAELQLPMAEDCHVFLWMTQRFRPMAYRLIEHWGLKYVLEMTWHKPGGFQPFGLPQYNGEPVIYARRGSPVFVDTTNFPIVFNAPRGRHSEKPLSFYETIARVTSGRRLDMFGRRKIEGFDSWGKEAPAPVDGTEPDA